MTNLYEGYTRIEEDEAFSMIQGKDSIKEEYNTDDYSTDLHHDEWYISPDGREMVIVELSDNGSWLEVERFYL